MSDNRVGGPVSVLAEALRELKERTPHSYDTLAARLNVSRSALHRYCTGKAVPPDFQVIDLLARHADAQAREVAELHRRWALARESQPPTDEQQPDAEETAAEGPPATRTTTAVTAVTAATDVAAPAPDRESSGGTPTDTADTAAVVTADVEARVATPAPAMELWRRGPWISAGLAVAVLVTAMITWNVRGVVDARETRATPGLAAAPGAERPEDGRKLFSPECGNPITMGRDDDCVLEVQELLADRGAEMGVDGQFGPETLRRLTAFQALAGLDTDGMAGAQTKEALYTSDITMTTWGPEQVTERIHEVFTEAPELAVRIADCQSFLDPLHVLPNTDGSRNWGVFQISDARLRDLRGTPQDALDPEWNIEAAHRLWAQNEDFSDWPHCLAAAQKAAR